MALAVALADTLQQGSFFVGEAMQADLVKSSEDIVDLPLFFILDFASSAQSGFTSLVEPTAEGSSGVRPLMTVVR